MPGETKAVSGNIGVHAFFVAKRASIKLISFMRAWREEREQQERELKERKNQEILRQKEAEKNESERRAQLALRHT